MSGPPLAAVLAGGLSRRMGTAKALVELGGEPLIARPLAAAAAAGLEVVVVAKPESPLPHGLGVPVWHEPVAPAHPLTGLVSALERAGGRPVVALACDMPFVPAELLARLAASEETTAPSVGGRLEPFPARYEAAGLPLLREALAREAPLREALAALAPAAIGDVDADLLASVNTPGELADARRRLAAASG